jgi:hypothetical protein
LFPVRFSAAGNGAYYFRQVAPVFGLALAYFYYRGCSENSIFKVEKREIILKEVLILAVLKGIVWVMSRGCEN